MNSFRLLAAFVMLLAQGKLAWAQEQPPPTGAENVAAITSEQQLRADVAHFERLVDEARASVDNCVRLMVDQQPATGLTRAVEWQAKLVERMSRLAVLREDLLEIRLQQLERRLAVPESPPPPPQQPPRSWGGSTGPDGPANDSPPPPPHRPPPSAGGLSG